MPFQFANADASPYQQGSLFLGHSDTGREIGIQSERHFLAVCGSGAGKGASLIIPNLLRWPHNSLVIDPGGGNVRATWQAREAMGQEVHVIDPVRVSLERDKNHDGIPARLLKAFNPIANLDPSSRTYGEDVDGIADGLVMRHEERHARWDNGAANIIAGLIDFVTTDPQYRDYATLPEVRKLLIQSPDNLKAMFEGLAADNRPALCRAAAATALADLKDTDGGLIQNAQENTKWLDYTSMRETLGASTCELSHLKSKPCTIYLVIDPDYMDVHARFLRLFVRTAISAMTKGSDNGRECLFILDEFFSLGKIAYLQKVAGLMRKNGVHLWPILQNLKQLPDLYGPDGADTFISNSDAMIFFGIGQDKPALDYVSGRIGPMTAADVGMLPPTQTTPPLSSSLRDIAFSPVMQPRPTPTIPHQKLGALVSTIGMGVDALRNINYSENLSRQAYARQTVEEEQRVHAAADANAMRDYNHAMTVVGKPRVAPDEIAALTGKGPGDKVARSMIVFRPDGSVFNLALAPYFLPAPQPTSAPAMSTNSIPPEIRVARDNYFRALAIVAEAEKARDRMYGVLWAFVLVGAIVAVALPFFIRFEFDYVPSVLLLFGGVVIGVAIASSNVRKKFEEQTAPQNLILVQRAQQMLDHMSRHGLKEIPLDN